MNNEQLVFVKNWQIVGMSGSGLYTYRVVGGSFNGPPSYFEMIPAPLNSIFQDWKNVTGISGQNEPTPSEKIFGRHVIAWVDMDGGGRLRFDPSYFKIADSWDSYVTSIIYGYGNVFEVIPVNTIPPTFKPAVWARHTTAPVLNQEDLQSEF
jgi:hypothetical protein